ncbi:hypothetical protein KKC08_03440 [Patescibacteria group bacterium]|nr:hypothetical protein [Patescibacteria group bacterium]MCG2701985.1 hypothetical protein [Candidatus Parcubacteria bacterium]MBU4265326.1 hypothetical protein [Patescibacteria group bacterium]MBU4389900.1 hypothetical protein [Patescibacteria group bacterium]MBU4397193.1 hypothetical protein [Patescibacteria group bacterium]
MSRKGTLKKFESKKCKEQIPYIVLPAALQPRPVQHVDLDETEAELITKTATVPLPEQGFHIVPRQ